MQQIIISNQNKKRSNQIILFVIFKLFPTPLWCTQICSLQPMPQPICANLNLRKAGKAASIRREAKLIVVVPRGGNVIYSTVKKWAAIYLPLAYISSQWCLSCHLVSATYRWVHLLFFLLFYSKMVHRWVSLLDAWSRANVIIIGRKFSIGRTSCWSTFFVSTMLISFVLMRYRVNVRFFWALYHKQP